jgi:Tfp pilus tip-associated adhesin PilY1
MKAKDEQGLYFQGKIKANNYSGAIKELYGLNIIPKGFCVSTDYKANKYSVVDSNGIQHIYDLCPNSFYNAFMQLN